MLNLYQDYFRKYPDFWNYLTLHSTQLEDLILNPYHLELLKSNYKSTQHQQLITKVQNLSLLLRMVQFNDG